MKRLSRWMLGGGLAVELLTLIAQGANPGPSVVISEFLAGNTAGLRDEDGDTSDWIELRNAGATAIDLEGWSLTDDPGNLTQWRIPSVTIGSGQYLVIFASGKNRTNPAGPLHTNFRLALAGEYLGLVNSGTNVVSEFAPAYPPQHRDISYGRERAYSPNAGFFAEPTPGADPATNSMVIAPLVEFSVRSGTYLKPFVLSLSTPVPHAQIRYELVQGASTLSNVPSPASPLYSGPIAISNSVQIRARAYVSNGLSGLLQSESYVRLDTNAAAFSSDLPLVILHSFESRVTLAGYATSNHSPAFMAVYEPRGGRSSLTNPPVTTTRVGLNVHGGSTFSLGKSSFNLEAWDESNRDKDVALLGMPAESDWLFFALNSFEPVLIHHSLINELSRQTGRYAPRTRLVEVFVSGTAPGGIIGTNHYNGVYVVIEKIKRSPSRVDLDRLDPQDTNAPALSGGYLLKMERTEPQERVLPLPTIGPVPGTVLTHQSPEGLALQLPEREPQRRYISNFFSAAATSLASPSFTNAATGYAHYLDPDSWIDHHMINVLAFNVDAFRLGGFLAKPRDQINERGEIVKSGRLLSGPIYDFDRSLGSTDGRDFNPRVWRSTMGDLGTDFFHYWWNDRLFRDPDFWQKWIDRWQELRQSAYSLRNMSTLIDSLRNQLREAQPREVQRWPFSRPRTGTASSGGFTFDFGTNGYEGEISFLKYWLSNRVDFIDTNFVTRPSLEVTGDALSGYTISLSGPTTPGSVLYYTLNGTDPRLPGGSLSPAAAVYSGPVQVATNARVIARTRNLNHRNLTGQFDPPLSSPWSGPVQQTLVVTAPSLRITELMYHPTGDPSRPLQFEFIELRNIGGPINLSGFRLRGSVEFAFPNQVLEAGQYVVVAGDLAGFRARYGPSALVAGQYLADLGNASGHLILEGPLGEVIHDFTYNDQWYPVTGGPGFSLVIQNEYQPLREFEEGDLVDNWGQSNSWRPSTAVGGSPGAADPPRPTIAPVYVNEVLARPNPGQSGFIELLNLHGPDTSIGGWFLTDDFNVPKKYRIPDGTLLPVGGYAVFNEAQFNAAPGTANSFALQPTGGSVYLFSANAAGELTGHSHGFQYGPSTPGVSVGRYLNPGSGELYVAQIAPTPGSANAGPRVGPVVISEIHYHPADHVGAYTPIDNTEDEFIELKNITQAPVALFDPAHPENTWALGGEVAFTFPPGVTLPAAGYALIVRFDPAKDEGRATAFRSAFNVPEDVPLFGPLPEALSNAGSRLDLLAPELIVYSATRQELVHVVMDSVGYSSSDPWPPAANGIGPSLGRLAESAFGNDPFNWIAALPSAGETYVPGDLAVITGQPQTQTRIAYQSATFTVAATGPGPIQYQWRFNGVPILGATQPTLILNPLLPSQAGIYDVIVLNPHGGVASAPAVLTVRIPVQFTLQPQNVSRKPGESASFSVAVESTAPPVQYQWFFNGAAIGGATFATYTIPSVQPADTGRYFCAVTDGVSTSNSATAQLTVLVPPLIVQQPLSQTAVAGATVVFSVEVSNTVTTPIGYRWRRFSPTVGFQELNSLTSFLVITNVPATSPVTYTVVVTNAAHTVGILSANAVLTILPDTDGDGLPDEYETEHGLDLANPVDAMLDRDGDTMTNLAEYTAGTNPDDRESRLKVDRIAVANGVELEFTALAGKTYSVQSTTALRSGETWSTVANIVARTNTRPVVVTAPLSGASRFYRVVTPAQP